MKTNVQVLLLAYFSLGRLASTKTINSLEVETTQGILRGKYWETPKGRLFNGFTGIPYAKPPIGDLRFKQPVPITSWNGILDATKSHDVCPQISIYLPGFSILGDEDCLYLNVYTPNLPNSKDDLLPVMFYIHGGSFVMGSAKPEWLGPEIFLDRDIVLVTTNYRLGALGFLSTLDDVAPGNNGLKDQNLALKWVKNNIANFGGDPEKITLFGNSAGAASVHFHTFSPLSRNLIKGAIIQSGSVESGFAILANKQAAENSVRLGSYVNCTSNTNRELIECLRNVDVKELITNEAKFSSWDNETVIPFKPVIEQNDNDAFLIEQPWETLKSGEAANIPLMVGIVAQECGYKSSELTSKPHLLKILDKRFNFIIPSTFRISLNKENASNAIRTFYFNDSKIDETKKSEITKMYSDGWFLLSHDTTVRMHKHHGHKPIYQYMFDYRGSTSYSTLFGDPYHDYGACHTDELLYFFKLGMTFPNYKPTQHDLKMSDVLTLLWTNFAKNGNPNPNSMERSIANWKPIQTDALEYYHIRSYTDMNMKKYLYEDRINFWRSLPVGIV